MPTKKQNRNKKRRSIGGVNPAGFVNTAVKGVEKASQNSSQQAVTRGEGSKLVTKTLNEARYAMWKGVATGEKPNFNKVGNAVQKRANGLKKATERGITLAGQAGIPTAGITSTMSSASTSLSTSLSGITKSASNSFSGLTKSASKDMGCVIL